MIVRVFGRVDGVEVLYDYIQGDIWQVQVPLDEDGEYAVEIIAEDDSGNQAYLARMLYTVSAGSICVHVLPLPKYLFERQRQAVQFRRVYPVCKEVIR